MNEKFLKALEDAMNKDCESTINSLPEDKPEFSSEFESEMNRLIKRHSRPYYTLISTFGRRAACIAVAFAITCGSMVGVKALISKKSLILL